LGIDECPFAEEDQLARERNTLAATGWSDRPENASTPIISPDAAIIRTWWS